MCDWRRTDVVCSLSHFQVTNQAVHRHYLWVEADLLFPAQFYSFKGSHHAVSITACSLRAHFSIELVDSWLCRFV